MPSTEARPCTAFEVEAILADVIAEACAKVEQSSPDIVEALANSQEFRDEYRRQIVYVLDDCVRSARLGRVALSEKTTALASTLGVIAAAAGLPADALAHSWGVLFDALLVNSSRIAGVAATPARATPPSTVSVLHRSISERNRISSSWHESAESQRIQRTQVSDLKRMARELHDWFGSNLSLAMRKLELYQLERDDGDGRGDRHLDDLHAVLSDLYEGARKFASGIRLRTSVSNLGAELRSFVESVDAESTTVDVIVRGDEALLPHHVRAETFILLREALRNVFAHSRADRTFVMVDISDDRVGAVVQDDGRGFSVPERFSQLGGTGLLSMRERVDGLQGKFAVHSAPGRGTRVELWIPVPGRRKESGPKEEDTDV